MSKQQFSNACSRNGVYLAALMASACGVPLAVVQLWIRSN